VDNVSQPDDGRAEQAIRVYQKQLKFLFLQLGGRKRAQGRNRDDL
jgi:hypothetical protein